MVKGFSDRLAWIPKLGKKLSKLCKRKKKRYFVIWLNHCFFYYLEYFLISSSSDNGEGDKGFNPGHGGQGYNPGYGGQGYNPGHGGQDYKPGHGGQGYNPGHGGHGGQGYNPGQEHSRPNINGKSSDESKNLFGKSQKLISVKRSSSVSWGRPPIGRNMDAGILLYFVYLYIRVLSIERQKEEKIRLN